jgi:hypothetical protein
MTTGALIFAFDNECIDYVAMASWQAINVKQHLGIPVAVVTDCQDSSRLEEFDCVIPAAAISGGHRHFSDFDTHTTWYNASRPDAYDLTPWDQTLVLDSDYVINSSQLRLLLDKGFDFTCFRNCKDITNPDTVILNTFGKFQMPMWWATVMLFRKCNTAQYVFDCMKMIRNNWQHYRDLYGINEEVYRNDYALSIALGIVSGHTWQCDAIPWDMLATLPSHDLELHQEPNGPFWIVQYLNSDNHPRYFSFAGIDFHAMGKQSLGAVIADTN